MLNRPAPDFLLVCAVRDFMSTAMNFLAAASAATTTVDKLRAIPGDFWLKLVLGIVALVALVIFFRKVAQMNKAVAGIAALLIATFVGFSWIYERNEPRWATPVVGWLGGFFPSKGAYQVRQDTPPAPPAPAMAKRS
jgi:MFS superfamily sulfate permease-like transporter